MVGDGAVVEVEGALNWVGPGRIMGWCFSGPAALNLRSNSVLELAGDGAVFGPTYTGYRFDVGVAAGAVVRQGAGRTNSISPVKWSLERRLELGVVGGRLDTDAEVYVADGAVVSGSGWMRQTGGTVYLQGLVTLEGVVCV